MRAVWNSLGRPSQERVSAVETLAATLAIRLTSWLFEFCAALAAAFLATISTMASAMISG